MIPELRAQIERCSGDRESLRRVEALLPVDDGELDRLIAETITEGEINAFGFVVLGALAANRPVDARHLAKSTRRAVVSCAIATCVIHSLYENVNCTTPRRTGCGNRCRVPGAPCVKIRRRP